MKVVAAAKMPAERNGRQSDVEGIVKRTVEEKVQEMFKKAAVVKKGGKRVGAGLDLAPNLQTSAILAKARDTGLEVALL